MCSDSCLGDGAEEQEQMWGGEAFGSSLALSSHRFEAGPAMDKSGIRQNCDGVFTSAAQVEQVENQNNDL